MPYIGQPPVSGDTTKSFRLLDNLASFTLTFDATSSSVVDTSANTLTFANHRFVTAQRVTYTDGGGTAIGGLTDGTAYFIIKVDQNTIQLASSASNANNSTAISLSSGAAGGSHTLNLAFDGTNTKFKATYGNGTKAKISRAGQLLISINGVLQQAQESSSPTLGFGLDSDSTIVFSQAPVSTDVLFGQILADTITNFDTQDNTLDVFTGDGSTTAFTLSKKPASSNDILVTLDGVVQYPTTTSTSNAYSVSDNTLSFTAAPADGVAIQVRHIGFAGATSSAVTGLYGRTGNVTLNSSDDDITVGNVTAGIITATSYGSISGTTASFSGNVSIGGTLTYEDVTNIDSVGLITARNGIQVSGGGINVTSGSIGIGTDSPVSGVKLHLQDTSACRLQLSTNNTGHTSSDGVRLMIDGSNNFEILQREEANIEFFTNNSERARIDSSGNFGLGTTSVGALLHIESNSADAAKLRLGFDSTRYYDIFRKSSDGTGLLHFYGSQSGYNGFVFGSVDGERMRIDTSGRLLLGTTTEGVGQADDLTVATSGDTGITVRSGTSSNGNLFFSDGTSGTDEYRGYVQYDHSANELIFGSDATARMRIDSSGRIGMGNDSPGSYSSVADDLVVGNHSGAHGITIAAENNNTAYLRFADGTANSGQQANGQIAYSHADLSMRFNVDASERMRIDSSGRLLLNHDSSINNAGVASKQQITGDSAATASLSIRRDANSSSGPLIIFGKSRSGALGNNVSVAQNDNIGSIVFAAADGTDVSSQCAEIKAQIDGTPGSNDTPGRIVFMTTSDGSNAPTERMRLDSNGKLTISNTGNVKIYADSDGGYITQDVSNLDNLHLVSSGKIKYQSDPQNDTSETAHIFENDGSEVMRIDSSGRLGLGTNGPVRDFHNANGVCLTSGAAPQYRLNGAAGDSNDNDRAIFGLATSSTHFFSSAIAGDAVLRTTNSGNLLFGTGTTERIRIDSSGRLLVGTSSSASTNAYIQNYRASGANETRVQSNGLSDGDICIFGVTAKKTSGTNNVVELGLYKHSGITNPSGYLRLPNTALTPSFMWNDTSYNFRTSTTGSHIGTTNGTVVGTQTSDERLKNVGADVAYGLAEVKQLQPKQYALKTEPDTNKLGFIAQQVESIIPEAVYDTDEELDGHQEGDRTKLGMEYVQLIPVLVNAIKELSAEVDTLKTKVAALEG